MKFNASMIVLAQYLHLLPHLLQSLLQHFHQVDTIPQQLQNQPHSLIAWCPVITIIITIQTQQTIRSLSTSEAPLVFFGLCQDSERFIDFNDFPRVIACQSYSQQSCDNLKRLQFRLLFDCQIEQVLFPYCLVA